MRRSAGFSKIEFAVVVAVLGLLSAVLLARLHELEGHAERLQVELTIRGIRVGIQLAIGERMMQGREDRIAEVASANPISLLGAAPPAYGLHPEASSPQWTYDSARRELRYVPRLPEAFEGARELRWKYVARIDSMGRTVGINLVGVN